VSERESGRGRASERVRENENNDDSNNNNKILQSHLATQRLYNTCSTADYVCIAKIIRRYAIIVVLFLVPHVYSGGMRAAFILYFTV